MELHELHIHQRHARVVGNRHAVAGVGVRVRRDLVRAAITARAEHHRLGAHRVNLAGEDVHRHDAAADVVLDDQVHAVPFAVELHAVAQRLFVDGVQEDVARPVGGEAGARRAVPAEAPLVDAPIGRAAEHAAHVLVFVDHARRIVDHDLDRILIAQPVRAFDRVEDVRLQAVRRVRCRRALAPAALRRRCWARGAYCPARRRCRPAPRRCAIAAGESWTARRHLSRPAGWRSARPMIRPGPRRRQ